MSDFKFGAGKLFTFGANISRQSSEKNENEPFDFTTIKTKPMSLFVTNEAPEPDVTPPSKECEKMEALKQNPNVAASSSVTFKEAKDETFTFKKPLKELKMMLPKPTIPKLTEKAPESLPKAPIITTPPRPRLEPFSFPRPSLSFSFGIPSPNVSSPVNPPKKEETLVEERHQLVLEEPPVKNTVAQEKPEDVNVPVPSIEGVPTPFETELKEMEESTKRAQGYFTDEAESCARKLEEMNSILTEYHEKVLDLTVDLLRLNTEILFMDSPVLREHLNKIDI